MEISSDKSKIIINTIKPTPSRLTNICMNGKMLEEVDPFKFLGSTEVKDETSINKEKTRLAQSILWKNEAVSFPIKIKLYKSLFLSILLYGC